ncbi:MAG: glycosyltransferase family 2 protein [Gammaproteobacteria bacterium]|nr:glycosyltransferase family 2 protein [Gammaproteobacteria bacterium]MBU0788317.1 glycosyltransferase family 2 protein [Gammaproteobacteria bacterium]MBU0815186.1 glycosyltransferase family 2 protein [Gammaproteobacteria bacterium]MBU1785706.1 glycosyltransferase family 2 protein [Gammaproteobacteria bacterium]
MQDVAVILPAFNEELTISATIEDFHRALPEASLWVVNNRSTDATYDRASATLKALGCRGGVLNEMRKGKGNAIRRAFTQVEADIYVVADADLTYPAVDVHVLLAPVVAGEADMVVGDRHVGGHYAAENKRAFHGFGNRLVRYLVNRLFRAQLSDILSGYRVFSRRFVKTYPILVDGFEVETDMTLHALDKRFPIMEIPVGYRDRPEGSASKLNTFRDGVRVLKTLLNILRHYRPLVFFGGLALIFLLLGLLLGLPVLEEWARTRYINRVPLAILATGVEIIAVVLAAVGLILDSIVHQDKRAFERELLHEVFSQRDRVSR